MAKYSVSGLFTGSKYLGVFEADSAEEAIEMALTSQENHASICHHCAEQIELDDHSASQGVASKIDG